MKSQLKLFFSVWNAWYMSVGNLWYVFKGSVDPGSLRKSMKDF